jgi:hypothetical protein
MKKSCKVFCRHCKYFKKETTLESMRLTAACNHPTNLHFSSDFYSISKQFASHPHLINSQNNCPNYKQKLTFAALKDGYTNKKALKKILLDKTLDKMQGTDKSAGLNPDSGMYITPQKIADAMEKMLEIQLQMQKFGFNPINTEEL